MIKTYCHYHPKTIAIGTCYLCARNFCEKGKRIFKKKRQTSFGEFKRYTIDTYEYCLPSHADAGIKESRSSKIIGVIMIIVGILFIVSSGAVGSPYIFPGIGLFSTGMGIFLIIYGYRKAGPLRTEKEIFISDLGDNIS